MCVCVSACVCVQSERLLPDSGRQIGLPSRQPRCLFLIEGLTGASASLRPVNHPDEAGQTPEPAPKADVLLLLSFLIIPLSWADRASVYGSD